MYEEEVLDPEWDDDGSIVRSKEYLADLVVGHRIVSAELVTNEYHSYGDSDKTMVLTLDDGRRVKMRGYGDCCAFAEVNSFLLNPERVDHVITGVGTTDGYTTWHVYADLGDVLELSVGWSCGNPFYYGYGFIFQVEDV